jgi:hypothetical protein
MMAEETLGYICCLGTAYIVSSAAEEADSLCSMGALIKWML